MTEVIILQSETASLLHHLLTDKVFQTVLPLSHQVTPSQVPPSVLQILQIIHSYHKNENQHSLVYFYHYRLSQPM